MGEEKSITIDEIGQVLAQTTVSVSDDREAQDQVHVAQVTSRSAPAKGWQTPSTSR